MVPILNKEIIKIIEKHDYRKDQDNFYVKMSKRVEGCQTVIWIEEGFIRIKAYGFGYGESDYLKRPFYDIELLEKLISENEV